MSLNPKNLKEENKMLHSPATWVPTLYFAMGMPFVVLNMVCTLMYKGMGVSDGQIAFWTSLIMLPWTLKPLWSPFLEIYKTKKFFVVLTQLLTGVLFALVAFALHLPFFFPVTIAILAVIAMSGATHDIAADGTYMSVLSNEEQARWIGWQGAFYNIAKIAATGGLVYLAGTFIEHFGVTKAWMFIMFIIATIMLVIGCYHILILPNPKKTTTDSPKTLKESLGELVEVFIDFFKKKHIVYYIFFIILYRFAEGFVMKIVPLFLKASRADQGLGLSEQEIGLCYGTFWCCCLCHRFDSCRLLYCMERTAKESLLTCIGIQYPIHSLYILSYLSTRESLVDWRCYRNGIFRLWLRLCWTLPLYDATDCTW